MSNDPIDWDAAVIKMQRYVDTYLALDHPSPKQKAALKTDLATLYTDIRAQKGAAMQATGKLLGRSTTLWVSLIAAGLNLLTVLNVVTLDALQIGSINTFALVLIGILANEENPTTAGTFSATTQTPSVSIEKS